MLPREYLAGVPVGDVTIHGIFEHGLPKDVRARSLDARTRALNPAERPRLRARVEGLVRLYASLYDGDPHLVRISQNVLSQQLRLVR